MTPKIKSPMFMKFANRCFARGDDDAKFMKQRTKDRSRLIKIFAKVVGLTLLYCEITFFWIQIVNMSSVLRWYTFSIGITFYNKWLFQWYGFHFPLLVTTVHMSTTFLWAGLARWYFSHMQGVKYENISWTHIVKRIFPAGAAAAFDIGLSNAAIATKMHINLYTICKSTVICFVLLFSFMLKVTKPTWQLMMVIFFIVSGVILFQAKDDVSFHSSGFFIVMLASMFGGLRWVLTQILLKGTENNIGLNGTVDTLYYVAPCMAITLLPFALAAESDKVLDSELLFKAPSHVATLTMLSIMVGACLAFLLTISEFLLVEYAGSLTMTVAGVFKELVTLVLAAATVSGNQLSALNVLGLCVSLLGIGGYNYIKYRENLSPAGKAGYAPVASAATDDNTSASVLVMHNIGAAANLQASPTRAVDGERSLHTSLMEESEM